jgi:hypothetical protein
MTMRGAFHREDPDPRKVEGVFVSGNGINIHQWWKSTTAGFAPQFGGVKVDSPKKGNQTMEAINAILAKTFSGKFLKIEAMWFSLKMAPPPEVCQGVNFLRLRELVPPKR